MNFSQFFIQRPIFAAVLSLLILIGGAISLFLATYLGIPVSTTHTITGSIIGVGSAQRARAVRWGVAGNIAVAWILTIPASALIAACAWWVGWQFF